MPAEDDTRAQWSADFTRRARAYWSEERLRRLVGDKRLLLPPGRAPLLLRALGLLKGDASMPPGRVPKYRQINHMLALVLPALEELAQRCGCVDLVDAGCGRSYLSMLAAWWLRQEGVPVRILGIDRNEGLLDACRRRAEAAGLGDALRFHAADLEVDPGPAWDAAFGRPLEALHGVLSLHACDTATDDALALAVRRRAPFVAVAPCCQAELARRWAARAEADPGHPMAGLWRVPHLRRAAAATLTDAYRLLLLRACGYRARAAEFVESVHTAKNTLIWGMLHEDAPAMRAAAAEYRALRRAHGDEAIGLEARLPPGTV